MKKINLHNWSIVPKEVKFKANDGKLTGYLFMPPGKGPFPCVIDNHGSATPPGTTDLSHPQTAALFLSWGIAYMFPHRAGYGNSPGVPLSEEVTSERGTKAHDEQMSKRLEKENQDVIAAMGSSLGGIHTLLTLAADQRWRCGIDFSGGASQWAKHPKIKKMLLDATQKILTPLCLIQPANDFDIAPTREISSILRDRRHPHEAQIFSPWGVDGPEAHRFCAAGQQIWGPFVKQFLEKFL